MNTKKLALLLVSSLGLLAACGGTSSSTVSTSSTSVGTTEPVSSAPVSTSEKPMPSTSSAAEPSVSTSAPTSSSSTTPIEEDKLTAAEVEDAILGMSQDLNFSLEYLYEDVTYTDVINLDEGYYYFGFNESGYIKLPLIQGEETEYTFMFDLADGEVNVGGVVTSEDYETGETYYVDLAETCMMPYIGELVEMTPGIFTQQDAETVVSSDQYLAIYLLSLLQFDASDYYGYFGDTIFTLTEGGDIHFQVTFDGEEEHDPELAGTFKNIGTSSIEELKTFVSTYTAPYTSFISADKLTPLAADEMKVTSKIELVDETAGTKETVSEGYLAYNEENITQYLLFDGEESTLTYCKDSDGLVAEATIDALTGDIKYEPVVFDYMYNYLFADYVEMLKVSSFLTADTLATKDGTTFDYIGTLDLIDILATYSGVELTGATVEGEAIIENGQVTGLKLVSNSGDDGYGNTIHYEAELKFGAIGEDDIINITAPSETAGDEFKAQFITGKLDGTNDVEITVTSEYADDSVKIVFYDDVVLMYLPVIEEVDGIETITSYTPSNGYVYREGKVIPFVLAEGADGFMVTSPSAAIEATYLSEVIRPFDLSPRVIEETGTNTYGIIDGVYNYGEAFPFTTYTPYATDIVINTDETHITSIVSDYTMWMAVGQETITYKYDNVTIDEALLTLIKGVPEWTTPTSWFTEDINVYNTLVSILGEEGVAKIPYIFKEALTGNWGTSVAAGSLQLYNDGYYYDEVWMETPDLSQAFLAEFMEALVENGFTRQEDYTDEDWYGDTIVYAVFTDETGIRVEVDLTNDLYNGGIYIFAPEA